MDGTELTPPADLNVVELVTSTAGGVLQAVVDVASTSPLVAVLFILLGVSILVRVVRGALYAGWRRDPIRLFTRTDKAALLARAGHRCERHGLVLGRCREVDLLQADHVHPWSRGGQTALPNGQVLCRRHNKLKGAAVPFGWQLRRLERQRTAYFPPGSPPAVTRRGARRAVDAA